METPCNLITYYYILEVFDEIAMKKKSASKC